MSGFIALVQTVERKPTVRQVYALAAALCERADEEFPETSDGASELIERLRIENGHPAPRRDDTPRPPRRHARPGGGVRRRSGADRLASAIAKKLAEEMR